MILLAYIGRGTLGRYVETNKTVYRRWRRGNRARGERTATENCHGSCSMFLNFQTSKCTCYLKIKEKNN